jgi:hypothetical protein
MIWPIATPLELPVSPPVHESRICHSAPEKRGPTLEIGHAPPQEKRIHRERRDIFVRYAEQRPGGRIVSHDRSFIINNDDRIERIGKQSP